MSRSVEPGVEVERLMQIFEANHGLTAPEARSAKVHEAQRILSNGPTDEAPETRSLGIAIGFVQSGKTMSFTTLSALAADNGYRVIVVILGNTHLLVGQNRERLADDLGIGQRDDWRWAHLPSPTAKADLDQLLGQEDRVVLITVLKHTARIRAVAEMFEASAGIKGVRALVIDDEADQASLNAGVKKGKTTPTYASIVRMRNALGPHLYVQYTATPFAPLLLEPHDGLAPEFAEILAPGEDYTGGRTFFLDERELLVRPVADDEAEEKAPSSLPEGLERCLNTFLVSTAYMKAHGDLSCASMLVHTSGLKGDHLTIKRLVSGAAFAARTRLSLPPTDPARSAWLRRLEPQRKDIVMGGVDEIADDAFADSLAWVLSMLRVWMVNSAEDGENPDWALSPVNVLIGGNKLDRGFTVRGLTTTYLTRKAAGGQADTIEQRARCYGYKKKYLEYCRVFAPVNVVDAFTALVHTEADMRASLSAWQDEGRPLNEWSADKGIVLPDSIRPTRSTVLANPYDRGFTGWSFLRRPTLDPEATKSNAELLQEIGLLQSSEATFGDVSVRRLPVVPVLEVVQNLLEPWVAAGSPGWDKPTLLRGLTSLVDSGLVEAMSLVHLEKVGGLPRTRRWRDPDGFDNLMQGENVGTGYVGDRGLADGLQLQIHHVVRRDVDEGTPLFALALYVPPLKAGLASVARRGRSSPAASR